MSKPPPSALIVHGGAGPHGLPSDRAARRRAMMDAVKAGAAILRRGGSALDAVAASVVILEDHSLFNAGYGSTLTADGAVEMDASVMAATATEINAGAVAVISRVKNPVLLARTVMEHTPHLLMTGGGAEHLAVQWGFDLCNPDDLIAPRARERFLARTQKQKEFFGGHGTVGAAALDRHGQLAAATSTGGVPGKLAGRIGDSAIVGAGTFASPIAAASATGHGEAIMLASLCRETIEALGNADPTRIARRKIAQLIAPQNFEAGIILVDRKGRVGYAHNADTMEVAIFHSIEGMRHEVVGADASAAEASQVKHRISRGAALVAFAIAAIILAQGISAPFVKDAEPQAASWIQDVASGNQPMIPRDYYGELARKPPLFYWAAAAITDVTGGRVDEVRARMVSVLAGAGVAVAVLTWSAEFLGLPTAGLAFLFLLGSYAFTSRGTLALEDMLLVALIFAAWCLLYPAIEESPSYRRIVAIGIVLGLGILTKGPVAIVLPAFGAVIYLLMTRRSIVAQMRQSWPWIVLAIAVAIALPWYLPALMSNGGELAKIMFQENAGHFLPASAGGTGEAARPFYYIAMKMIGGTTPLNFLLPALVVGLIRGDFVAEARKPLMFQLSFLLAMLIFFSLASAKRDDYVLPGMPSLAILFAALFTSLKEVRITPRLRDIAAIMVAGLAMLGLVAAAIWISRTHNTLLNQINPIDRAQAELFIKYYIGALSLILVVVTLAVLTCGGLIISGLRRRRPVRIGAGLGALSLLGVVIFTSSIRPETARERTLKYAASDINRIAPSAPIYVINENQELSFYLAREAPVIGSRDALKSGEQPSYLFAYPGDFRGPVASLKDRLTLIRQWDRLGKSGSPALYKFH